MKIQIIVLVVTNLVLFQKTSLAEPVQKFQSLSSQEVESACETVKTHVLSGTIIPCAETSQQPNDGLNLQQNVALAISENNSGAEQIELLLVERHIPEKTLSTPSNTRMADVYTYNYHTDTLTYATINLLTRQVVQSEQKQNVQLPLTENEINRSRLIANEDQVLHGYLEQEYLKITGQPLQSLDQLVVKAFIFLAKSMPDVVNNASKSCGLHRCARLVMHTPNRIALETSPIIDLSAGVVTQHSTGEQ